MQRLQTRPQFQAVLAGTVVAKTVHFVLHRNALDARAPQPEGSKPAGDSTSPASLFPVPDTWIGAMVPKRWAKRAVTRNAIKRQIYTVSNGFSGQYPEAAFVVRLRREFSRQQFISATSAPLKEAVRHEVQSLLQAGVQAGVQAGETRVHPRAAAA
ncbi:MAG: ribonuclease P protein component [Polaromonas sp.]|nr:ribonuclease P protein component [Polaromonas sp.]